MIDDKASMSQIEGSHHMEELSKRKRKSEFAGIGCVYQAIGLLCPFILAALLTPMIGIPIGIVMMVILFIYGSIKSSKWVCGSCLLINQ